MITFENFSVRAGGTMSVSAGHHDIAKSNVQNNVTIPEPDRFSKGDIVKIVGLKSKPHWNDLLATIIGEFIIDKKRWPIQINTEDKPKALLKTNNLILDETTMYEEFEEEIVEFKPRTQGPQAYMCHECGAKLYKKEAEIGFCYACEMKKNTEALKK